MDIDQRIKDIMSQKQACKQERRFTFDEYKKAMQKSLADIDGVLFIMFHELACRLDDRRSRELDEAIKDFQQNHLQLFSEKLKDCFY